MEYFIIDNNGQQAGPFSQDQLVQKAISPETLVWKQGMADWTPAWKVEELKLYWRRLKPTRQTARTSRKTKSLSSKLLSRLSNRHISRLSNRLTSKVSNRVQP